MKKVQTLLTPFVKKFKLLFTFAPQFYGLMQEIRNVAIIAHVDHGKTTLVDKILFQTKLFKDHERPGELIMDSNELERERGITIRDVNSHRHV